MAGKKYGIDLGSNHIRIYKSGQGIVLDELNRVAFKKKKELLAVGNSVYDMLERTPASVTVVSPVKQGVITDITDMKTILEYALKKIGCSNGFIGGNEFYLTVPTDITEVEKKAFFDLILQSVYRSQKIHLIEKPLACALGERINVTKVHGLLLVDIGFDTTEISLLAERGLVFSKLVPLGGQTMNQTIIYYVKRQYHLIIGDKTAEDLKLSLGSARPVKQEHKLVCGKDMTTGLPVQKEISSACVFLAIRDVLTKISEEIKEMLLKVPPEMRPVVQNEGIFIAGGVSQMPELKNFFELALEMRVSLSEKPKDSSTRGLGIIIENPHLNDLLHPLNTAALDE